MPDIQLVCEGVVQGRDQRWYNLALDTIAETIELASRVRVMPAGSKADLVATVRGLREALKTPYVYAIRDRDFVPTVLLDKGLNAGVHSLRRHCIESYLLEPVIIENALGLKDVALQLEVLAQARSWSDLTRAVLDALGYQLRQGRLGLGEEVVEARADVSRIVHSKLSDFRSDFVTQQIDVEQLIELYAADIRSDSLWQRVNGKELLKTFAATLDSSILPGGDLEGKVFKWCKEHGPPPALVEEVKRVITQVVGAIQKKS